MAIESAPEVVEENVAAFVVVRVAEKAQPVTAAIAPEEFT
jgi:hypothetical protein